MQPIAIEEMLDTLQIQVWGMTDERTYAYANAAHAAFLGKTCEEIAQQDIANLLPASAAEICIRNNRTVFNTKKPVVSEEWAFDASGTRRLLRIVKTPKLNESGNVSYLGCVAEDITEQHYLAEQNLIRQQVLNAIARFSRELFSSNPDAVEQGLRTLGKAVKADRVYYWENHLNQATGEWLTSQKFEWCAEGIEAQIDNQEMQNIPLNNFPDLMSSLSVGSPYIAHIKDIENEAVKAILAAQQIQSILIFPLMVDGAFMGFVGFDSCKEERIWTEQEIALLQMFVELLSKSFQKSLLEVEAEQSRKNFDNFFNTIDALLCIFDPDGNFLHVNNTVIRKTGYSEAELIGQSIYQIHPPERRNEMEAVLSRILAGSEQECHIPVQTKSGEQFPVVTRICPGEWNGRPAYFGTTQDTTFLEFTVEKFSRAFENSSLMMAIVDTENGAHIEVNDLYCQTLGYKRSEIIGKTPFELNIPATSYYSALAERTIAERVPFIRQEVEIRDKNGALHSVIISVNPVKIGVLSCEIVSMLDITERKNLERELERYNERLEEMVQDKVDEVSNALWGTINSLVRLAESRDDNTGAHLRRISDYSKVVATVLSFNSVYSEQINYEFIVNIQQASQLHDIGKVAIPDSILLKPGKLTREEFDEMKKHTIIGAQTLEQAYPRFLNNGVFKMAIDIALSHHERWDGKGYPTGLKGDDIPLAAQIVAICDVYDALRSVRTYKPAFSHEESLNEIRKECGTHFSQALSDAFFNCTEEIRRIYDSFSVSV